MRGLEFVTYFPPYLPVLCGQGRDVDDTDSFSFNREFKAKLMRLKINSIQAKETVRRHMVCLQLGHHPMLAVVNAS